MARGTALLAVGGLLVAVLLVLAGRPLLVRLDVDASQDAAAIEPLPPAGPPAPLARARPVAEEFVALPPVAAQELERVAPREPLSIFARPLKQKPRNQGRVFRPLIGAAGSLSGSGFDITIAGIEVTPPDRTCTDGAGLEWPCGIRARTAFRSFVRGRALKCALPEDPDRSAYTVACELGRADVGAWLVKNGWALALPGSDYAELEEEAQQAGRGLHGPAPVAFTEAAATE